MRYQHQDSRWHIVIDSTTGYRTCSLYDSEHELDPMEDSELEKIHEILPELMNAVRTALELYDHSLWPEMLLYAKRYGY